LHYVQKFTNIPVPQLYDHFEYNGAYYVALEYVEGVNKSDQSRNQKEVVNREIETHLSLPIVYISKTK
jgi:hypothetical protein